MAGEGKECNEESALVPESQAADRSPRYLLLGYAMVFFHAVCMTTSSASVQALSNRIPHFELVLMRFFTLTVVASIVLAVRRESPRILGSRRTQGLLIITALINTTTFTLYYASSYFISLGPIGGLYRSTTLIMSIALARCLLGELLNNIKVLAMVSSIIGMVMIVLPAIVTAEVRAVRLADQRAANNPPLIAMDMEAAPPLKQLLGLNDSIVPVVEYAGKNIGSDNGTVQVAAPVNASGCGADRQIHLVAPRLKVLGYLLILVAGAFNSTELILLSGFLKDNSSTVQAFWFGVCGTVTSALIMALTETPVLPCDGITYALSFLHGLGAAFSIFTFICALKYLPASNAAITQSIHIALMYIAQWTVMQRWNTESTPLLISSEISGTILILIGVLTLPVADISKYVLSKGNRDSS